MKGGYYKQRIKSSSYLAKKEPHSSGGSELWGDIFFFRRF